MINNRGMAILLTMMEIPRITLLELSIKTKIPEQEILRHISSINDMLRKSQLKTIKRVNGQYTFPERFISEKEKLFEFCYKHQILFSENERIYLLYLYIFSSNEYISSYHLQELLAVSRNTTLNDLKRMKKYTKGYEVSVNYTRNKGYHIAGEEFECCNFAYHIITELVESSTGLWMLDYLTARLLINTENKTDFFAVIKKYEQGFHLIRIQNVLLKQFYFLQFFINKPRKINFLESSEHALAPFQQYTYMKEMTDSVLDIFFSENNGEREPELFFFVCHLLFGCFIHTNTSSTFFEAVVNNVVSEMERLSLIEFEENEKLKKGLLNHIIPAYFRIKIGFNDENDYTDRLMKENIELFTLVKRSLKSFEKLLGKEIPNSEVAYIMIHFGGYMKEFTGRKSKDIALIFCPNGVSSSLIIKNELQKLFPNLQFKTSYHSSSIKEIDQSDNDLVFSTTYLNISKPQFIVRALLTDDEKQLLSSLVTSHFPNANDRSYEMKKLIKVIKRNALITNKSRLQAELMDFVTNTTEEKEKPRLEELLTKQMIQFSSTKLDWQAAIRQAAIPLLENRKITNNYVEAMIQQILQNGPFIVLKEGVAIPHAKPEDGVNSIGMSMLILEKPTFFLDSQEYSVKIIIVLAAIDNNKHLNALLSLSNILKDNEKVKRLMDGRRYSDIEEILATAKIG